MTRSEPLVPDRANAARGGMGVTAAIATGEGEAGEAIRRELARLTALIRRHFSKDATTSLLPALVDISDPAAAVAARQFLEQIRGLAQVLEADVGRWADSPPIAGAFADFRRETLALLEGVEERIGTG